MIREFEAEIFKMENLGWTGIIVGFDVRAVFGVKGFPRVRGTLDGKPYSGLTLMPAGDGAYMMGLRQSIQKQIGKGPGMMVSVSMELDPDPLAVPDDLADALDAHGAACDFFHSLSDGNKRHFIRWIEEAKRPSTRSERIGKSLAKLTAKRKWWQD